MSAPELTNNFTVAEWLMEDAADIIEELSEARYVALADCGDYELPERIIATLEEFVRAARKPQS